jgi:predicted SprT family Zn-dependent metalloprotease
VDLPSPNELERLARDWLQRWRVAAPEVAVRRNDRLRTCAGRAFYQQGRIELNPHLLGRHPDQVETVLVHETAHLAACRLFGKHTPAHGRHWRALMAHAGLPPEPCHKLEVQGLRRSRHYYLRVCDACGARRIARAVRYPPCRCGAGERYLVMRASANQAGLRALRRLSLPELRRRCIMAAPE